jgi:hypothetical protein
MGLGHRVGLQVEGSLDDAGKAHQGEFIDLVDALAEPRPVQPGQVADVGPAVTRYGDGQDVAGVALLKLDTQHPGSVGVVDAVAGQDHDDERDFRGAGADVAAQVTPPHGTWSSGWRSRRRRRRVA